MSIVLLAVCSSEIPDDPLISPLLLGIPLDAKPIRVVIVMRTFSSTHIRTRL